MNYKLEGESFLHEIEDKVQAFSIATISLRDSTDIPEFFETIQNLYLEGKDFESLHLIQKLIDNPIANDRTIFPSFEKFNLASILIDYLNKDSQVSPSIIALRTIVTFSQSNDVRYIEKFIHLQILDKIKPLLQKSFNFTAFIILETSLVCKYHNSIAFFREINLSLPDFFNLIIESHNHNIDKLMFSFDCFAYILDPILNEPEVVNILQGIDHLILNLPPPELINCISLLKYVINLTNHNIFFNLINQTNLKANIIDLLYRLRDMLNENFDFTRSLFSLISFFSQFSDCPTIPCEFLIDLIRDNKLAFYSPCIVYIIGNLFKIDHDNAVAGQLQTSFQQMAIQICLQKNFVNDLFEFVQDTYKCKIESLTCLSKMITYSNFEIRKSIVSSFPGDIVEFTILLVDSILIGHDDILYDRVAAILTIFEDLEKIHSKEELKEFVTDSQIMTFLEFEFKDLSDVEDDLIAKMKCQVETLFKEE